MIIPSQATSIYRQLQKTASLLVYYRGPALLTSEMASRHHVDVVVIGGGLCGVLAGQRCTMEGLSYTIVEKENDFGGVWGTLANKHSHLQVCLR